MAETDDPRPRGPLFQIWRWGLALGLIYLVAGFLASRISGDPLATGGPNGIRGVEVAPGGVAPITASGVFSVHTSRSHDAEGTLEDVASAARSAGLDWVVLGDHPRGEWPHQPGALDPRRVDGVHLSSGAEVLVANVGRTLVVGLDSITEVWEGDLASLGDRVREDGGFTVIVHPRSPRWGESWKDPSVRGTDAFESFDVSEMARTRLRSIWGPYHLISFLSASVADRIDESVVRLWRERSATPALLAYDSLRSVERIALTGGLNHHAKTRTPAGFLPPFTPFFRTVVNHLELEAAFPADPVAAEAAIAEAVREGRLHVSLGWADQAQGFRFAGTLPAGAPIASGGVVPWGEGARMTVDLPPEGGAPGGLLVRVLRDGEDFDWVRGKAGDRLTWIVPGAGIYRVEIHRGGIDFGLFRLGLTPWIFSNPIEFTGSAPEA